MAYTNPTGNGAAVALKLTADQVRFLRGVFDQARDGVRDDLANYPEGLKDPEHLRCEDAAYGRLLTALDELVIVPDPDVLAALADLATMIDASNQYGRVVSEHETMQGLLDQLSGGR